MTQLRTFPCEAEEARSKTHQAVIEIGSALQGVEISGGNRVLVPVALLQVVLEHHTGILILSDACVFAPPFALVRPMFEGLVRAVWLHHCASDLQLSRYCEMKGIKPSLAELIESIEAKPEFSGKFFSKVKELTMNAMHDYTHGGSTMVTNHIADGLIEPSFDAGTVVSMLNTSTMLALVAGEQIAKLSRDPSRAEGIRAMYADFFGKVGAVEDA